MARTIEKLSPAKVEKTTKPGLYGDGAGLWLHVGENGKSWIFRFMLNGRAREMGLGPLHTIGLGEARKRAARCREMLLDGIDPIEARNAERNAKRLKAAKAITFQDCADRYIKAHRAGWRNEKHAAQWTTTLTAYAYPTIGKLSVSDIATAHVTKILEPIWTAKPETASRVRGRIEAVLDYAATHKWRDAENPARWRGHLENLLAKRSKVARVEHHAALPWKDMAAFMDTLTGQEGAGALALRFAILTAARTGEVIGARWAEIDTKEKIWTIPADRMKAAREHRVPLSDDALAVLEAARKLDPDGEYVFPGGKKDSPLSNMAMLALLRRMGRDDLTTHGFRSTFRDWAADTGRPADIAEAALAHVVGDKTVAAYQRGDLLERRRRLMTDWASHCAGRPTVVAFPQAGAA
ncbi:MAG TPA: integrase arm-type DNA-binding domain-containing protein [Alphaproteobacteria bacterium]|nr:integrase arm-type DNA-binding domain-containing protein [Alphaproteobacteria bacterium]